MGMPRVQAPRRTLRPTDYIKLKTVLEALDVLIDEIKEGTTHPTNEQRRFYDNQDVHWVHAANRTYLTQYISRQFIAALK